MTSFSNIADVAGAFAEVELDTGVDFADIAAVSGVFGATELDTGVDFIPTGDLGATIVTSIGFGEGGFGEGPFGGYYSSTLSYARTQWTNVDTP